jgi:hypothetical protein
MVTTQALTDETLTPIGDEVPAGGALFHLPSALRAYGPATRYDLRTPLGLLKYAVAFVQQPRRKVSRMAAGELRAGIQLPVGRDRLCGLLADAVRGGGALANLGEAEIAAIRRCAAEIRWESRLERTSAGVTWRHHAHVLGADGFYALVATLIADGVLVDKDHGSLLRQCTRCKKFFFVRPRAQHEGRPEKKYCGKTCRKKAHAKGGVARQRVRRARQQLIRTGVARSKAHDAVRHVYADHRDATAEQLVSYAKALMQSARHK